MSENKKFDNENLSEEVTETVSTPAEDLLKQVVSGEKDKEIENQTDSEVNDKKNKNKEKKNHKKFRHGIMSTVLIVVFIAVVVFVNVVATVLFDRYPITIDLTNDKIYSISEESENYVKKINVDTLITVFAKQEDYENLSTYTKQTSEMIKKYSQYNSKISYRYVDIDSNPDIMKDYEANTVSQYDIIVETNPTADVKRTRKISLIDIVKFKDDFIQQVSSYSGQTVEAMAEQYGALSFLSYYGGYVESSTADQALLSAFMTVTDPNPITVTMLTGRNEVTTLGYFQKLLEANGYTVKTIDITKEEIPEDTNIAVIPAPKTDYLDTEIQKVDDYLNNDGKLGKQLLYAGSLSQGDTPKIDEFLAEYGLELGEGVICESSSDYYYQQPFQTITNLISENFTQDVSVSKPVILNLGSRPIKLLFDEKGQLGTEAYVTSTDKGYVADATSGEKKSSGKQIYTAVASKATSNDNGDVFYSNIIAYGSVETLSDQLLSYAQFQNREYIISLLNGITHKTDGIVIAPKVIEGNVFDITDSQKNVLKWTFILIIPVVVLVIGGIVWFRRKNR